jgi:hypothetical protein
MRNKKCKKCEKKKWVWEGSFNLPYFQKKGKKSLQIPITCKKYRMKPKFFAYFQIWFIAKFG